MSTPAASGWRRISGAERSMAAALGAFALWALLSLVRGGPGSAEEIAYVVPPLAVAVGMLLGRLCSRADALPWVAAVTFSLALALFFFEPFYENAAAAAGIQLTAVAGLILTSTVPASTGSRRVRRWVVLMTSAGAVTAIALAARSQAAFVLAGLMIPGIVLGLHPRLVPARRAVLGICAGGVAAAAAAVVVLAGQGSQPEWVRSTWDLGVSRHHLWADALALWRERPVVGGGPGSFYEFSDTARSDDLLYAAHSSLLQVAAELGAIGVVLFLAVLVAGAFVATQGDPARGLIGVAAWCALAVHSMIDHLYEFPLVCLLAGAVIGWSGARSGDRHATLSP